jgi:hypothetical protein
MNIQSHISLAAKDGVETNASHSPQIWASNRTPLALHIGWVNRLLFGGESATLSVEHEQH